MRAIILAAGMGTRLRPLTDNVPKGLVKVNGVSMVEKQVQYLKEAGIEEIIILTGYLKEKFNFLKEKYGVKLINNSKYDIYNNIYTMYLVRDYLQDAYVLEGDIYMNKNIIDTKIDKSTYFGGNEPNAFAKEWKFVTDDQGKIKNMEMIPGKNEVIFRGISYWTNEDGKYIGEKLQETVNSEGFENLYWDDVIKESINDINLYLRVVEEEDLLEVDSVFDLMNVEAILEAAAAKVGSNLDEENN